MFNNAGVVGAVGPIADTSGETWGRTIAPGTIPTALTAAGRSVNGGSARFASAAPAMLSEAGRTD